MKNLTAYFVTSCDATGKELIQKRFDIFNREEIIEEIKTQLLTVGEGCEVEYWKCDKKYAYNPLQTYVKRNGKVKRMVIKGEKVFYSSNHIFA